MALLVQRVDVEVPPKRPTCRFDTYDFTFARYSILRPYPPRSLWQASVARLRNADPALTRLTRLIARMRDGPPSLTPESLGEEHYPFKRN
jgi:hypothetical protein